MTMGGVCRKIDSLLELTVLKCPPSATRGSDGDDGCDDTAAETTTTTITATAPTTTTSNFEKHPLVLRQFRKCLL